MGYRSDVAFAISKEAYFKYKTILQRPLTFLHECDTKYTNNTGHYFLTYSVKWYDSYTDVQEMVQLMSDIEADGESDSNMLYAFCRIGEDSTDIEISGSTLHFDLNISQEFYTPDDLDDFTG